MVAKQSEKEEQWNISYIREHVDVKICSFFKVAST